MFEELKKIWQQNTPINSTVIDGIISLQNEVISSELP